MPRIPSKYKFNGVKGIVQRIVPLLGGTACHIDQRGGKNVETGYVALTSLRTMVKGGLIGVFVVNGLERLAHNPELG
jgi:hypothetical protein